METKSLARAWMTHGRAVRLLKLLSLDIMDTDDALLPCRTLRVPRAKPMTSAEIDETRRTFWVSFNMDFLISALTQTAPMLQVQEVSFYVFFILHLSDRERKFIRPTLTDLHLSAISKPIRGRFVPKAISKRNPQQSRRQCRLHLLASHPRYWNWQSGVAASRRVNATAV